MVDQFAETTRDDQWIHVDVERARRESPFGGPVAHGFLTLSLVPYFSQLIVELRGVSTRVNYGLEKVRFPHPVRVGSRIRATQSLVSFVRIGERAARFVSRFVIEIEGVEKPACVADVVTVVYA
jgi:acyl dehydratase